MQLQRCATRFGTAGPLKRNRGFGTCPGPVHASEKPGCRIAIRSSVRERRAWIALTGAWMRGGSASPGSGLRIYISVWLPRAEMTTWNGSKPGSGPAARTFSSNWLGHHTHRTVQGGLSTPSICSMERERSSSAITSRPSSASARRTDWRATSKDSATEYVVALSVSIVSSATTKYAATGLP